MNDDPLLNECVAYLRARSVFVRMLDGFREKYLSYGRFAGVVVLEELTAEERVDLEGFLQRNCHGTSQVRVTAQQFEQALQQSRFAGIDGESILRVFYDAPLLSKKAQQAQKIERWQRLLSETQHLAKTENAQRWLAVLGSEEASETLVGRMRAYLKKRDHVAGDDLQEAARLLTLGVRILNRLPLAVPTYLAVFAAELTGDPHAFDRQQKDGGFLTMLVRWLCAAAPMHDILGKQHQYLQVGLLLDDVSNYVMTLGLRAWKKNGEEHMGMAGFFAEREPVQLPLADIVRWSEVRCPNDRLYMVENPTIYAVLCERWQGKQALVCVGGQPRLSVYELLDRLVSETEIWYAGDFDPEGILIAERLACYCKSSFHFWHMCVEDYYASNPVKSIDDNRLRKLENLSDPMLRKTAEAIAEQRAAGYQENLLQRYIDDIV